MIVKICGVKTLEIAHASVEAGADMLGFNFYPRSSRNIAIEKCAEIIAGLKDAGKLVINVGVFVNEDPLRVQEILGSCDLDLAQLCGDESPEDLITLKGKAFKAVRPNSRTDADQQLKIFGCSQAPVLLVDANVKGAYGGTGETGDWTIAQHLAAQAPIMLAGGLNPENVATAIKTVNPWGVDAASGVESSPGTKDPAKISAFIAAVRAACIE